jgi:hypothetical protein
MFLCRTLAVALSAGSSSSSMRGSHSQNAAALNLFTYSLGSRSGGGAGVHRPNHTIYIPLTSYCNSCTLPQTRGPNFVLPSDVVASLCRVRDAESSSHSGQKPKWEPWCRWLDCQDGSTPQKLPPADESSYVARIPDSHDNGNQRPTVSELVQEVDACIASKNENDVQDWTLVIGGEGEPTLRLNDLIELMERLRDLLDEHYSRRSSDSSTSCIRVTTNGLLLDSDDSRRRLFEAARAEAATLSVALMTNDANQYDELMRPLLVLSFLERSEWQGRRPHDLVTSFIQQAIKAGIHVETTAVDRPGLVDRIATNELSRTLGVVPPVRWRPYFP